VQRPDGSPRNVWHGRVTEVDDEGERLRVRLEGDLVIVAEVTPAAIAALGIAVGSSLYASVKATDVTVYPS
jgi:molybdopterin-binding protein